MPSKQRIKALVKDLRNILSPALVIYWGVLLGGLYLFIELAEEIYERKGFWFDEPVLAFFAAHRTGLFDYFFRLLTWAGSSYVLVPSGMGILIILLRMRCYTAAVLLCVGFGGAALTTYMTKLIFTRHRPELFPRVVEPLTNLSFPSGHTTQITAFMLCLFLIIRRIRPHWQIPTGILAILLIAIVATSRIYLQVHYPSDVLAGLLIATIWVLGVDGLLRWQQNRKAYR